MSPVSVHLEMVSKLTGISTGVASLLFEGLGGDNQVSTCLQRDRQGRNYWERVAKSSINYLFAV